jgi:hypothetical protein
MNKEEKQSIHKALAEYNEIYTADNLPEFTEYVVRMMELGNVTPDEAVVFSLVHFYSYYKDLDIDLLNFIGVVEVMGEVAENEDEDGDS